MMDKQKRWGNSAMKGHGVNSPAMMEARKGFAKSKALSERTKDHRALVMAGKRIVGDKTPPYWKRGLSKKAERPAGGMYGDAAMRRFTANKERKHKQWDAEGKGK